MQSFERQDLESRRAEAMHSPFIAGNYSTSYCINACNHLKEIFKTVPYKKEV